MAASAIAIGVVWILDQGSFDEIAPAAYPATLLAVVAVGLLVGTLYGRSRLLIAVGVVAALATAATAFVGPGPYGERIYRPQHAGDLQATYTNGVGHLVVHLEDIANPGKLEGAAQTVDINEHIGAIEVIVPSTIAVVIDAHVDHGEIDGPPHVISVGDSGGEETRMSSVPAGGSPALVLNLDLDYGQIAITQYDCGTKTTTGLDTHRRRGGTDAAPACP
jgi:hypothetical protein